VSRAKDIAEPGRSTARRGGGAAVKRTELFPASEVMDEKRKERPETIERQERNHQQNLIGRLAQSSRSGLKWSTRARTSH